MSAVFGLLSWTFAVIGIREAVVRYRNMRASRWHRPRALLLRAPDCVAGGHDVRPWHKHDACGPACPWSPLEVRVAHDQAAWAREVPLPARPDRVRR